MKTAGESVLLIYAAYPFPEFEKILFLMVRPDPPVISMAAEFGFLLRIFMLLNKKLELEPG